MDIQQNVNRIVTIKFNTTMVEKNNNKKRTVRIWTWILGSALILLMLYILVFIIFPVMTEQAAP